MTKGLTQDVTKTWPAANISKGKIWPKLTHSPAGGWCRSYPAWEPSCCFFFCCCWWCSSPPALLWKHPFNRERGKKNQQVPPFLFFYELYWMAQQEALPLVISSAILSPALQGCLLRVHHATHWTGSDCCLCWIHQCPSPINYDPLLPLTRCCIHHDSSLCFLRKKSEKKRKLDEVGRGEAEEK